MGFLSKAFERNRLPDLAARKEMAMRTGVEESRTQVSWMSEALSLFVVCDIVPRDKTGALGYLGCSGGGRRRRTGWKTQYNKCHIPAKEDFSKLT